MKIHLYKRNIYELNVSIMEIFELRYFLGAAQFENLQRASEKLNVSPGSLSKTISRLESELSVPLFSREGRHIRLTDHGRLLQRKAAEILQMEESARIAVGGHTGAIRAVIAGPEVLLSEMGMTVTASIRERFPQSSFEFQHTNDADALEGVQNREAHLAIVTSDVPAHMGLTSRIIAEPKFQTYVGKGHPLYSSARAKKSVSVERVLEYPFASPSRPLLGQVGTKQSVDGWRDDQFPRRVEYLSSSLGLLGEFAARGLALVYLPDYYGDRLGLLRLRVTDCPYVCVQKVRLVTRSSRDIGWMNQLF